MLCMDRLASLQSVEQTHIAEATVARVSAAVNPPWHKEEMKQQHTCLSICLHIGLNRRSFKGLKRSSVEGIVNMLNKKT